MLLDTHTYGLRSGHGQREEPRGHDGRVRIPQDGVHPEMEAHALRCEGVCPVKDMG